MTDEDKKLITDYMGWKPYKMNYYFRPAGDLLETHDFDLNDAGLCVQEMARNGAWRSFYESCFPLFVATNPLITSPGFLNLWLYDADNFFTALAAWIKEGREEK
jgi:hypothetical protein